MYYDDNNNDNNTDTDHDDSDNYDDINNYNNNNGCTVEVYEWIINLTPHFIMDIITYPCWD